MGRGVAVLALLTAGCIMPTAEGIEELADPEPAVALDSCVIPGGDTIGASVGSGFAPFELLRCDGETFSFYEDGYCEARATVVFHDSGWCGPSRGHTTALQDDLVSRYRDQGVRFVQILLQSDDFSAADLSFCESWQSTYHLAEHTVLIDPMQLTASSFPDRGIPAAVVVDARGTIRFRIVGEVTRSTGDEFFVIHQEIAARLDEILAAP